MDVLGCLFDVLPFLGHVASRISKLLRAGLIPRLTGLALGLFFEETSNLHYVREFLSHATDIDHDTLVKLRQGYISECNSISVAVGIFTLRAQSLTEILGGSNLESSRRDSAVSSWNIRNTLVGTGILSDQLSGRDIDRLLLHANSIHTWEAS